MCAGPIPPTTWILSRTLRHWLDLGLKRLSMEPVVAPPWAAMALKEEDLPRLRSRYWQLAELCLQQPFTFFHFIIDWERGQCGARRAPGAARSGIRCGGARGDIYPVTSLSASGAGGWVPSLLA